MKHPIVWHEMEKRVAEQPDNALAQELWECLVELDARLSAKSQFFARVYRNSQAIKAMSQDMVAEWENLVSPPKE